MIVVVDDMITIGDFSSRCGLSPKVLRTYAEAGVLVPAAIDPTSGYRYDELAQLDQADTVRLLRRAGSRWPTSASSSPSHQPTQSLSRRQALAVVRCRLGVGPERTRGATEIEVRSVRDLAELRAVFDLAGAQLPEPIASGDHRVDDLVEVSRATGRSWSSPPRRGDCGRRRARVPQ